MKNPFDHLDKLLEHSIRLRIMVVLAANPSYDYNGLKDLLEVTDGNLATHLKTLEREKYISVSKSFVERKPNTRYRISDKGRSALRKHMEAMAEVVRQGKNA
jgi:DNA-binding PadR family transcriptional regulator